MLTIGHMKLVSPGKGWKPVLQAHLHPDALVSGVPFFTQRPDAGDRRAVAAATVVKAEFYAVISVADYTAYFYTSAHDTYTYPLLWLRHR